MKFEKIMTILAIALTTIVSVGCMEKDSIVAEAPIIESSDVVSIAETTTSTSETTTSTSETTTSTFTSETTINSDTTTTTTINKITNSEKSIAVIKLASNTTTNYDTNSSCAGAAKSEETITNESRLTDFPTTEKTEKNADTLFTDIIETKIEQEEAVSSMSANYLGYFRITGYCGDGQTANGETPKTNHTIAMNTSQRKELGLSYGDVVYIEGDIIKGYYTIEDCGCNWGVIDVFCNSETECYRITSWADVYSNVIINKN